MKREVGEVVIVKPLEPRLCKECDEEPATHAVWLDLRDNGIGHAVTEACEPCADQFADLLGVSLAEDYRLIEAWAFGHNAQCAIDSRNYDRARDQIARCMERLDSLVDEEDGAPHAAQATEPPRCGALIPDVGGALTPAECPNARPCADHPEVKP